jgi:hypothetical protein
MQVFVKLNLPLPRFIRKIIARRILLGTYHYDRTLMETARLAGEEYSTLAAQD